MHGEGKSMGKRAKCWK